MNYSKSSITKTQRMLRSRKRRVAGFIKVFCLRLLLIAVALGLSVGASAALGTYRGIISKAPALDNLNAQPETRISTVYCSDGITIAGIINSDTTSYEYVDYEHISEHTKNAFIALYDPDFREHKGINLYSLFNFNSENSNPTITLRLLDNQIFKSTAEKGSLGYFIQSIQKQYTAFELEHYASKEKIIEYYLNSVNLGYGATNIQAAAHLYFGKDASELTISESAVLAPLATEPSAANPVTHPTVNMLKRQETLDAMLNHGFITNDQYMEAMADTETVYLRAAENKSNTTNSYFIDALIDQLMTDFKSHGYSSYEATNLIYNSGLVIQSTQDRDIQGCLNRAMTNEENFPEIGKGSYYALNDNWTLSIYLGDNSEPRWKHYHTDDLRAYYSNYYDAGNWYYHNGGLYGISTATLNVDDLNDKIDAFIAYAFRESDGETFVESGRNYTLEPQAAMVVTDPKTGNVLGLYGSRGRSSLPVLNNRAANFYQPGSAFSVLSAFMPALDTGGMTLASTFDDSWFDREETDLLSDNRSIANWYTTGYEGLSSIRRGIYHSMNIVAARCYETIGASKSMSYLSGLGFTRLDENNSQYIYTAMGELKNGVSLLELTNAYGTIANSGAYNSPRFYTRVYDSEGNLLLEKNNNDTTQLINARTAALLTDAMKDTIIRGTGRACAFKELNGLESAGKTGNSSGNRNLWFVGYTPYYCAGVWSGFDGGQSQQDLSYHKVLWSRVMEEIHRTKELTEGSFTLPEGFVRLSVCSKCGKLAVPGLCDENMAGNLITEEIFAEGSEPAENCSCCVKLTICNNSGMTANENCPNTHSEIRIGKLENEKALLHGGTLDSAYCLTEKLNKSCNIHIMPENQTENQEPQPTGTE